MAIIHCEEMLHLKVSNDSGEVGGIIVKCEDHQGEWHVAYTNQPTIGIVFRRGIGVIKWQ